MKQAAEMGIIDQKYTEKDEDRQADNQML